MTKRSKKVASEGFGDTVAKIANFIGIDVLAKKIACIFAKEDCGCERRRQKLNRFFPYSKNKRL